MASALPLGIDASDTAQRGLAAAPAVDGDIDPRDLEPVRVAVVGLGYWGPNLVRNLHEIHEGEVVSVCDRRPETLEAIRRRYPAVRPTTSFEQVLADPEIEAVALATPVSTHYALGAAALAAGKHVFVEKPLAASSAEATELIHAAEEGELVLMPGHTFLYSPPVNIIRDLVATGELGQIYFVSMSRVNLGLHQSDVSVVWDLAPHDFSILRYWLQELPSRVSAVSQDCIFAGSSDIAFINLEFDSRTIAHVELSWLAPSKLRRTTIVGSRKMVVYDDTSNEPVRIFDSGVMIPPPETFGEFTLSYRTGDIISPRIKPSEPLSLELADFCRAIRTGAEPRSNAELGLDVVRMIEAVDRSLELGSAVATSVNGDSAPHADGVGTSGNGHMNGGGPRHNGRMNGHLHNGDGHRLPRPIGRREAEKAIVHERAPVSERKRER
jgi:predicted dehydrogenase